MRIASVEQGHDWSHVAWLNQTEKVNLGGWLVKCPECNEPIGLMDVSQSIEVEPSQEEKEFAEKYNLTIPNSFAGAIVDECNMGKTYVDGYRVPSEAEKNASAEAFKILEMSESIIYGPPTISLMMPPQFDLFEDGVFRIRNAPIGEHSRFIERLSGLRQMIDLLKQEVHDYEEFLRKPEGVPYPDLTRQTLEGNRRSLEKFINTYMDVYSCRNDMPSTFMWVDTDSNDLSKGIGVVCPSCGCDLTIKAEIEENDGGFSIVVPK